MAVTSIWKYELEVTDVQKVAMPRGARVLHVDCQRGALTLWAQVYPDAEKVVEREFWVVGTGHRLEVDESSYVGSAQCGIFVWHVFDAGERGVHAVVSTPGGDTGA